MRNTLYGLLLSLSMMSTPASAMASSPFASEPFPLSTPGSAFDNTDRITYFAKSDETFSSIAEQYTLARDGWHSLAYISRIDKDAGLPVGFSIIFPAELLSDAPIEIQVAAITETIKAKFAHCPFTEIHILFFYA